jgi:hypothetical protein
MMNFQINDGRQFAKDDHDNKTVYGFEKNRFKGFGDYNNELLKENEGRINELVDLTKQEFLRMTMIIKQYMVMKKIGSKVLEIIIMNY